MAKANNNFMGQTDDASDLERWKKNNKNASAASYGVPSATFTEQDRASPTSRPDYTGLAGGDGMIAGYNPMDQGVWADDDARKAFTSSLENWYFPDRNQNQNAYQYEQDFGENARRFNENTQWQQASDIYSMGLAGRNQSLNERVADEQADQFKQQFGFEQTQWGDDVRLREETAGIERAYREGLISNDQARQAMEATQYKQTMEQNVLLANLQAWGRQTAPSARWMSSF